MGPSPPSFPIGRLSSRILQLTGRLPPGPIGGSEVHLLALAERLQDFLEVVCAAPAAGADRYTWCGLPFELYPPGGLGALLQRTHPDAVHLHALEALGPAEAGVVLRLGIPLIVTLHHGLIVCPQGSALQDGKKACQGPRSPARCVYCMLTSRHVNPLVAAALTALPLPMAATPSWTPLRPLGTRSRITDWRRERAQLFGSVDAFVVPARWIGRLLERMYRVLPARIHHLPQALAAPAAPALSARAVDGPAPRPHRLVYLGRVRPLKGIDLLVHAVIGMPASRRIEVHLHCAATAPDEVELLRQLQKVATGDPRVRFHDALTRDEVLPVLAGYDALVAPSRVQEVGPLVMLEAFEVGLPVIGADCGGIRERVTYDVDGLLFETGSVESLRRCLERICLEPDLLPRLRENIMPVPRIEEQIPRYLELYDQVLRERSPRS